MNRSSSTIRRSGSEINCIVRRLTCAAITACMLLAGCGHTSLPLDPNYARTSLERAMEQWKSGADQTALTAGAEPIVMNDVDWRAGSKLVSYKILDSGETVGSNMHTTVELVLNDKKKKPKKQKVTYIVGTSPVVTIFRN